DLSSEPLAAISQSFYLTTAWVAPTWAAGDDGGLPCRAKLRGRDRAHGSSESQGHGAGNVDAHSEIRGARGQQTETCGVSCAAVHRKRGVNRWEPARSIATTTATPRATARMVRAV